MKIFFAISIIVVIICWILEPLIMFILSAISFVSMFFSARNAKVEGEISDF